MSCLALGAAWAGGLWMHPFAESEAISLGAALNAFPPVVGSIAVAMVGLLGLAHVAWPTGSTQGSRPAAERVAWMLAGVCALVLVDGRLLMLVGYALIVVVMGWFDRELVRLLLEQVASPVTVLLALGVVGALAWGRVALQVRRDVRHRCSLCGRGHDWDARAETQRRGHALRVGRTAVVVAAACALLYPVARLPWMLGVPVGVDAETWATPEVVQTGIALGVAALFGVGVMTGLVRDWGVRVPRGVPALSHRRIPIGLGVIPAAIVALALVALGRGLLFGAMAGQLPASTDVVHVVVTAAMLPWGLALAVSTVAYAERRRGPCAVCGGGLPERLPSELRRPRPEQPPFPNASLEA